MIETTVRQEEEKPKYPYLGTFEGMVILFTEKNHGAQLRGTVPSIERPYEWDESMFEPFKGEITLKNK